MEKGQSQEDSFQNNDKYNILRNFMEGNSKNIANFLFYLFMF